MKIKQEMFMTQNEHHYHFFMNEFTKKLTTDINEMKLSSSTHKDYQWSLLIWKFILDIIPQWCLTNEIPFSLSLPFFLNEN